MGIISIRRFDVKDASEVSTMICRNFMEININDYPMEEMKRLSEYYNPDKITDISSFAHLYVACSGSTIVGCGAISSFNGNPEESMLMTIFVLPEFQGKGIGRTLVETLEKDEYFLGAKRIELHASITAYRFYLKLGYCYKDGNTELDSDGLYRLEKYRVH